MTLNLKSPEDSYEPRTSATGEAKTRGRAGRGCLG
jgi:hypothetical protein